MNHRYSATYAIDRSGLGAAPQAETIPVLHLGQPEAIDLTTEATYPITIPVTRSEALNTAASRPDSTCATGVCRAVGY